MKVQVLLHLESTDEDTVAWWAESEDVPGFVAAAGELVELRRRVREALDEEFPGGYECAERLVVANSA